MKISGKLIKEFKNYKNLPYDMKNIEVLIQYFKLNNKPSKVKRYVKNVGALKNKYDHLNYLLSTLDKRNYLLIKLIYIENLTYMECIEFGEQIGIDFGFLVDIGEKLEAIIKRLCEIVDLEILKERGCN